MTAHRPVPLKLARRALCSLALLVFAGALPINAAPLSPTIEVEVFSDTAVQLPPIPGTNIVVHALDAPERVKAQHLPSLPADRAAAETAFQRFMASPQGRTFGRALGEAYRGRLRLMQYQVQKLPAITFEQGRYAVYGTLDVAHAVELYRHRKVTP